MGKETEQLRTAINLFSQNLREQKVGADAPFVIDILEVSARIADAVVQTIDDAYDEK